MIGLKLVTTRRSDMSDRISALKGHNATMDDFAHLSVLISIVLGLGITKLLMGLARIVQMRGRVKVFWPTLVWVLMLLVLHVQTWWTMFGLRTVEAWTFLGFAITLMQPILLFFLSALALPDFDRDEVLDLRSNYFLHRRWFFGILIALPLVSLARTYVLDGRLPQEADFIFHLGFIVASTAAAAFANETFHKAAALLAAASIFAYVALLFTTLQ
ncbi:MAG: hypothetical protein ABL996_21480 [Micropepsaceae bacterium]